MVSEINKMSPLLPEKAEELHDLALSVIQRSASLGSRQHPVTLSSLHELLRIINSYYSNLIEGHNTHPIDIVRAMQKEYYTEPAKRNLQLESIAHISVQRGMEKRLQEDTEINIMGQEFLCYLHSVDFQLYSPVSFSFIPHFFPLLNYRIHPAKKSTGLHKL